MNSIMVHLDLNGKILTTRTSPGISSANEFQFIRQDKFMVTYEVGEEKCSAE